MRGVTSDHKFREPFDPFSTVHRQDDYTEGNAWQYVWLVPHDVHGLVAALVGRNHSSQSSIHCSLSMVIWALKPHQTLLV